MTALNRSILQDIRFLSLLAVCDSYGVVCGWVKSIGMAFCRTGQAGYQVHINIITLPCCTVSEEPS